MNPKVKETEEAVILITKVASAIHQAGADGKYDLADLGLLLPIVPSVGPAIENFQGIPSELMNLDGEGASELVSTIMTNLSIGDVKAKEIIGAAIEWIVSSVKLMKAIKG